MFVDWQFLRRQRLFLLWISISVWSLLFGLTGSIQASDLSLNIGIPSASTQASDLCLNICIPSACTQTNDLSLNIYTVTTVAQNISLSDRFYVRRINTRERGSIMTLLCHWPLYIYIYIPVATPRTGSPPCFPFSNVVKTLGVTLDAELSMEQHVSAVVRSCFFHIRSLSKVRPYITYKAASSIAVCLILSKLDYCYSLLSGLPPKQIKRLQAVQNAAARTVMKCKKTDHITPILRQLHWLPIQKRIRHKILSATYRSVHDNTPLYLSDLLQKHNPSRLLTSASRSLLDVPGPRDSKTTRYGQRAFRNVAPSLWNVLPESIKEDSIQSFRPSLKTHFFTQGW